MLETVTVVVSVRCSHNGLYGTDSYTSVASTMFNSLVEVVASLQSFVASCEQSCFSGCH